MTFSHGAILVALLTCGAAATAAASQPEGPERWVAANATGAAYVDAQPVIRKDDYAVIWRMQNFTDPRQVADGQARSMKYQVEYNCADRQQRALYSELYSGSMATGKLVGLSYQQHQWQPATTGSHGFDLACQNLPQPAVVASAP